MADTRWSSGRAAKPGGVAQARNTKDARMMKEMSKQGAGNASGAIININDPIKEELNSLNRDKQKEAVKKVIAGMTVGKDMTPLFMDMLKCMMSNDVELKKLVYLYLINYAKTQPDFAIMAVNAFVRDSASPDPMIRAMSIRTMSSINVEKIAEHLNIPLRKCLKDENAYVRKTAATCVVKLFSISPELVEDQGYLDDLHELLEDANAMVVGNACQALEEIAKSHHSHFQIKTFDVVSRLLLVLDEGSTEWGQISICDCLVRYKPANIREATQILDRVIPRLQHNNGAVVLGAIKLVLTQVEHVPKAEQAKYLAKLTPPLVTMALLSSMPEVQYVALRNMALVVQLHPTLLCKDFKVFFCKYNDPLYVKLEKLEMLIRLVNDRNLDPVLAELKEYAREVDVDFVRKAVRAIGRVAIKFDSAARKCVDCLMELVSSKVGHVVQEGIVVIKDIFRKYPGDYEGIIADLCDALDSLDEPDAKAALIWIVGEYSDRIDNAHELLEVFIEGFHDDAPYVQLQMLTATVKLFLHKVGTDYAAEAQANLKRVLTMSTEETQNPDLRDRGFIYWRLLSTDPESAKMIVNSEKPTINDDFTLLPESLLNELIPEMGHLSSVFHKSSDTFLVVPDRREGQDEKYDDEEDEEPDGARESESYVEGDDVVDDAAPRPAARQDAIAAEAPSADVLLDITEQDSKPVVVPADRGEGMEVRAAFVCSRGELVLDMSIRNVGGAAALGGFMVNANHNCVGVKPVNPVIGIAELRPGESGSAQITMHPCGHYPPEGKPLKDEVDIALKNSMGKIHYCRVSLPLATVCKQDGGMDKGDYMKLWQEIGQATELPAVYESVNPRFCEMDELLDFLYDRSIYKTAARRDDKAEWVYLSLELLSGVSVLLELGLPPSPRDPSVSLKCKLTVRCTQPRFSGFVQDGMKKLLCDDV